MLRRERRWISFLSPRHDLRGGQRHGARDRVLARDLRPSERVGSRHWMQLQHMHRGERCRHDLRVR